MFDQDSSGINAYKFILALVLIVAGIAAAGSLFVFIYLLATGGIAFPLLTGINDLYMASGSSTITFYLGGTDTSPVGIALSEGLMTYITILACFMLLNTMAKLAKMLVTSGTRFLNTGSSNTRKGILDD